MAGHVNLLEADAHGVARLVFSHPGKLNALSVQMWRDLRAIAEALNALPHGAGPRAIVLQG